MSHHPTTADLSLAIRDALGALDNHDFPVFGWGDDDPSVLGSFGVEFVDVSDVHNPIVQVANDDGSMSRFRLAITRID